MMRAGDDDEDDDDAEYDAEDADVDTDEDDPDGGFESVRAVIEGDGDETAVDGFTALAADANEIGNADAAVRLAPL